MIYCRPCKKDFKLEALTLKMGGLLCPKCCVILVWPYQEVYWLEFEKRRNKIK